MVESDDVTSFFASAPALEEEDEVKESVAHFVARHGERPIVCVTSGGTAVPLERRCVRFIDNFSAGNRGAASAEYFLRTGYAVLFLTRRGSAQPFARDLPPNAILECLEAGPSEPRAVDRFRTTLQRRLQERHLAVSEGLLLSLDFTSLFHYLHLLRLIATSMRVGGKRALFYLAAAVSDFYVPWEAMAEHKIQSSGGPLAMDLPRVPKMLSTLRHIWAPQAFVVSFKLETDAGILMSKAVSALAKHGVHAVVANELTSRALRVDVVSAQGRVVERVEKGDGGDVEEALVKYLVGLHGEYMRGDSCIESDLSGIPCGAP